MQVSYLLQEIQGCLSSVRAVTFPTASEKRMTQHGAAQRMVLYDQDVPPRCSKGVPRASSAFAGERPENP